MIKRDNNYPIAARKLLTARVIKSLQRSAQKAIYNNAPGDPNSLLEDLQNGPLHVFDDHTNCKEYYCENVGDATKSIIDAVRSTGLYRLIIGTFLKTNFSRIFTI